MMSPRGVAFLILSIQASNPFPHIRERLRGREETGVSSRRDMLLPLPKG